MDTYNFNSEQQIAFNKYVAGENVFITGPGGSGKSYFIQQVYKHACDNNKRIQITAMTGCAAILLESCAKTLHSWANIGLASGDPDQIAAKISKSILKRANWTNTEILIIDEVSMMSQKIFELLNTIGKKTRRNQNHFGNIQVIFCGDFYQLPPVGNNDDITTSNFCFESPLWDEIFPQSNQIEFNFIFRQDDEQFKKILNEIRHGKLFKSSLQILNTCINKKLPENNLIKPTILYPTKKMVDHLNQAEMEKFNGYLRLFTGEEL